MPSIMSLIIQHHARSLMLLRITSRGAIIPGFNIWPETRLWTEQAGSTGVMDKPRTGSVYGVGCEMCIIPDGGRVGEWEWKFCLRRTDSPVRYSMVWYITVRYNTIRSSPVHYGA